METKTLKLLPAVFAATTVVGCMTNEPPSEEWRRAEQSVARQEMAYTNGMAWPPTVRSNEIVMSLGMRISASTSETAITIEAGHDYERSWTRGTALLDLPNSGHARLAGTVISAFISLGQVSIWKFNGGITRGVLQEGVLWFKTMEDALNWLNNVQPLDNCVYSKGGLVVAWKEMPARKQLNVDVWQLMIGGVKPTALLGSRDEQIKVTHSTN